MKLYLLSQSVNEGSDSYDSCVVAAESKEIAVKIHPSGQSGDNADEDGNFNTGCARWSADWAYKISEVTCKYLGEADSSISVGVICSSFNAG